jgi:Na+/phosphate symporter
VSHMLKAIHAQESREAADRKARAIVDDLRDARMNTAADFREGRPESLETTSLHLDILSDLKRIHSHICSVAYPVLEPTGELQPNRLREVDAGAVSDPMSLPPGTS